MMKKMEYTTKIGEGIGYAVTYSFRYRYRAFRRCQTTAQAEGSVRYSSSINLNI